MPQRAAYRRKAPDMLLLAIALLVIVAPLLVALAVRMDSDNEVAEIITSAHQVPTDQPFNADDLEINAAQHERFNGVRVF